MALCLLEVCLSAEMDEIKGGHWHTGRYMYEPGTLTFTQVTGRVTGCSETYTSNPSLELRPDFQCGRYSGRLGGCPEFHVVRYTTP